MTENNKIYITASELADILDTFRPMREVVLGEIR